MEMKRIEAINILFLGEACVGKTNIISRFCNNKFYEGYLSTLGLDQHVSKINVDDKNYKLILKDSPGQERFRSLINNYIRTADIFIMVYDITNRESFEKLQNWLEIINNYCLSSDCIIGVIGNKEDLYSDQKITREEGLKFANLNSFYFTTLSAKDNIGPLNYFIESMIRRYLELKPEKKSIYLIDEEERRKKKRKTCCQNEIYFPFMERFKGRVFPWYLPIWEFKEKNKKNSLI